MKAKVIILVILLSITGFSVVAQKYTGLSEGYIAPKIKLKNLNGKKVGLSDFEGKVVLIYFWASWSEHSRSENSELKRIFNEYRNQRFAQGNGFVIYSIALEKDASEWFAAVQQDGLSNFINVSEVKFMSSKVAKEYNIRAIPMTFLIDGQGVILARGINSASLENKLAQMVQENTRIIK
ncbi:MAG: TlpA family protein disulfide reductase [Bacteroidales bacterium]|nr:TlpA family protein disulfide reductase [Bacteroidales bacterium]